MQSHYRQFFSVQVFFHALFLDQTVMITLDFESFMRSVSACELNPEKTTICVAPILLQANIAIGNSGTIGR